MALDWVPCTSYDLSAIVPPGDQLDRPLLNDAMWNAPAEVIGDIEGEDQGFTVLRIVGFFSWSTPTDTPTTGQVYARCWPGFQNQGAGVLDTPGILGTGVAGALPADVGLAANEKWWWERVNNATAIGRSLWEFCDPVAHPFWSFADFKPKMNMGQSFIPVLSLANGSDAPMRFIHRWRMLVRYR